MQRAAPVPLVRPAQKVTRDHIQRVTVVVVLFLRQLTIPLLEEHTPLPWGCSDIQREEPTFEVMGLITLIWSLWPNEERSDEKWHK